MVERTNTSAWRRRRKLSTQTYSPTDSFLKQELGRLFSVSKLRIEKLDPLDATFTKNWGRAVNQSRKLSNAVGYAESRLGRSMLRTDRRAGAFLQRVYCIDGQVFKPFHQTARPAHLDRIDLG